MESRFAEVLSAHANKLAKNTSRIRHSFVAGFTLDPPEGDRVKVHRTDIYIVQNLTDEPQEYAAQMDILESERSVFGQLTLVNADTGRVISHQGSNDPDIDVDSGRDGVRRLQSKTVTLAPNYTEGSAVRVCWDYFVERNTEDSDIMSIGLLTYDLSIRANYDPSVFEVWLYSLNNPEHPDPYTWSFEKDQLWLPEQHFQLLWKPKTAAKKEEAINAGDEQAAV